jgi:hypothetical protein
MPQLWHFSVITNSDSTILNQLEVGSIMVRSMKSIAEQSLSLSMYRLARSMQNASYGVLIMILDGKSPYLPVCLLFTW